MALPDCNKNCKMHFHHTSGRHLRGCALEPYDDICASLDMFKHIILSGEKIDPDYFDAVLEQLEPFKQEEE